MQRKLGKEGYSKTCPGKNVSMNAVRKSVADQRTGAAAGVS